MPTHLTDEEIRHIAKLARLSISDKDVPLYREQLASILTYVSQLQLVDTTGVPELAHASGLVNMWREDEPEACSEATRRAAIDAFVRRQGDLLQVQAVFEDRRI